MFQSSISQKRTICGRRNNEKEYNHEEQKRNENIYFPIENDRPVILCIGNVVGSITVHSYHT
jgi:hypothetical protein